MVVVFASHFCRESGGFVLPSPVHSVLAESLCRRDAILWCGCVFVIAPGVGVAGVGDVVVACADVGAVAIVGVVVGEIDVDLIVSR